MNKLNKLNKLNLKRQGKGTIGEGDYGWLQHVDAKSWCIYAVQTVHAMYTSLYSCILFLYLRNSLYTSVLLSGIIFSCD